MHVLIVDDSSTIRLIVRRCIEHAELGVDDICEAGNGEEALNLIETKKVDLVLCDINMPKMDGIQLLSALKQDERLKSIPIVMITTEAEENAVFEAVKKGALGYIKKPFTPGQILDQLAPVHGRS
jgi:two-component system chemotaxis response regulator CheY